MFQSGDVIYIYCVYAKPKPKYKYAITINDNPPLFFLINTQPRRSTPDAQIYIQKHELPCLMHDSYVD